MKDLLTKFTLYDVIGTFVPGFIALIYMMTLDIELVEHITNFIQKDWIIVVFVLALSYSFGWFLSELSGKIFLKLNLLKKTKFKYLLFVFMVSIIMIVFKTENLSCLISSMICFMILAFFLSDDKGNNDEYETLKAKVLNWYENITGERNIKTSPYYIIQTEDKYNRIHNYCSSKVFSKNMAMVCIIILAISIVNYVNSTNYSLLFFNIALLSVFAVFIFYKRYKSFEMKVNLISTVFFIDYLHERGVHIL